MAMLLKQSTAVDVLIGPFLDKTDALTAETGESPAVKLSKNGQALGAKNDVTTPVHDADGYHNCELDATDTNTVGTLVLTVIGSANALPVRHEFQVVEQDTFEYLYATGSAPDTQVAALATTADLLDKLGAVDEAAAAGDPSTTESVMQYVKQIINILVGGDGVVTFPAEAAPGNAVSLAEVIRAIHADVTGLAGSAMVGTNSAATAADLLDKLGAVDEAAAVGDPSTTESVMQYVKQILNVLVGSTGVVTYPAEQAPANNINLAEVIRAIHADVTGLAGSAMRGTNSAATAADLLDKLGAVDEAAAAGDPSSTESVMQYVKQIVNVLVGSTGITTFPAAADPANGISIAEVLRRIFDDTDPMVYTKANELDVNTQSINGAAVVGDGNATPWDGA